MLKARKRLIAAAAAAMLVLAVLFVMPPIKVSALNGSGKENDPYLISSAEELRSIARIINEGGDPSFSSAYYTLENNIDLSGSEWTPIGTATDPFKGTFDGNSHIVSGITINRPNDDDQGLFGYSYSAAIKNVGVINADIKGSENVGGICGYSYYDANSAATYIENCYFTGEISGMGSVGGICGEGYVDIRNCYNNGEVSGNGYIGGICGTSLRNASIKNCHNTGKVSGRFDIGGICGRSQGGIKNCYNTGVISGTEHNIGGICGSDGSEGNIKSIDSCYNTGSVSGTEYAGGICGFSSNPQCDQSVKNCYNTGKISGTDYVGGICGKAVIVEVSFNVGEVTGSGSNSGGVCGIYDKSYGSVTNSYYTTDSVKNGNGFGTGITVSDFCNDLPSCFDSSVWTAGSAETVSSNGSAVETVKYHLPYLTTFGSDSQQDIDAQVYNNGTGKVSFTPIYTAQELQDIKNNLKGTYVLMNDIDVSSLTPTAEGNWTAIGTDNDPFTGIFDGNGHTVSGIKINNSNNDQGLFGAVKNATIKNVGVINADIKSSGNRAGGICGRGSSGSIENCYFSGKISGNDTIGGICGIGGVSILNCYNLGEVSGNGKSGGIIGLINNNNGNSISSCHNAGTIRSSKGYAGGIAGSSSVNIDNCYNTGEISAINGSAGGICGYFSANYKTIQNCYNTGKVSVTDNNNDVRYNDYYTAGGICGFVSGSVKNCFNTGEISLTDNGVSDKNNNNKNYNCAGGIIGDGYSSCNVQNCYNAGNVNIKGNTAGDVYYAGGICGLGGSSVASCYNIGKVSGTDTVVTGGVSGNNVTVTSSYYNSDIIKTDNGIGTGKTTLEMTVPAFLTMLDTANEWTKPDNIKGSNGGTAYYPALTAFADKAPSVKYTTKLGLERMSDNSGFIVSALVKFAGMSDFRADDTALTSGKGTYSITANGRVIESGDIPDNTKVTVSYAADPENDGAYLIVYDGTNSDFFADKMNSGEMHRYGEWLYNETEHWRECIDCGETGIPEAHAYDEGTVTAEPTERTSGSMLYICTVCGYAKSEAIAPISHPHVEGDEYSSDETGHWLTCTLCDEKLEFAPHASDNGTVTKEPTETENGEKQYKCTVCGYVIKTETIPATGRKDDPVQPVDPDQPRYIPMDEFLSIPMSMFTDKLNVSYEADGSTLTVSWDEIDKAGKYIVYLQTDGKYKPIKYTKDTSATLKNLKNDRTYRFIVKYIKGGSISPINYSARLTVKMHYKPTVTAEADRTSVTLTWKPVPDAEKYEVYRYENGKAKKLCETEKTVVKITGLKPDTEYSYIVRAYADGKWSIMTVSDIVTARTLA